MGVRGWPAWIGLWTAGAVGLLCALMTPEALLLRTRPPVEPDQVSATDGAIAAVPFLAVLLLPWLVGLVSWRSRPRLVRVCLLLCAGGLVASAWAFRGVPDAGPGLAWGLVVAAGLAVAGALLGPGTNAQADGRRWLAATLAAVLVLGAVVPGVAVTAWILELGGALDRHEESESGWYMLWCLPISVGLVAAAVAAARRWWSTCAASVVVGSASGVMLAAPEHDLGRFPW